MEANKIFDHIKNDYVPASYYKDLPAGLGPLSASAFYASKTKEGREYSYWYYIETPDTRNKVIPKIQTGVARCQDIFMQGYCDADHSRSATIPANHNGYPCDGPYMAGYNYCKNN